MVSGEQQVQICVCLALILCLRLAGCRFFDGHVILAKVFKAPVHLVDDTMKVLLDIATLAPFVEAFLDDARMHPFLPNLVNAYMWRKSCGSCTAAQVAQRLHCALKRR